MSAKYTPEEEEQGHIAKEILMEKGNLSCEEMPIQHTPTPWKIEVEDDKPDRIYMILGADGVEIVQTDNGVYGPSRIDAEFMVRAVNLHEELLDIARKYSGVMEDEYSDFTEKKRVDDIIAKAEGK